MMHKIIKNAFFLEAYINFASGLLMVFKPVSVTEGLLGRSGQEDEATLEMIRWFGVMVFAFGFNLLYRTLCNNKWEQTKVVFQSFLISDVVFTYCAVRWTVKNHIYTNTAIFNVLFSLTLCVFRIFALMNPKWHGFDDGRKKD